MFIKENWELIKQGAGLLALRTWLLVKTACSSYWVFYVDMLQVLLVNNFLLPEEVATLMRYYQELANIRL